MLILIEKDAATKVPKEVADLEAARGYEAMGFTVRVQNEDGSLSPLPSPGAASAEPEETPAPSAKAKKAAKAKG